MKILKLISIADVFTTINALLGLGSIFATLSGWYYFAVNLILIGVIADGVDGVFARRFSKKWYLGDYLDLMSDTVTFCVAPSVLMFTLYFDPDHLDGLYAHLFDLDRTPLLILAACGAIVVTGVLRLARFCYESPYLTGVHFIGIPTPAAATTLSLLILLDLNLIEASTTVTPFGQEIQAIPPALIAIMALALAVLMICDSKFLKMRGKIEILAGGLLLLAIVLNEVVEVVAMVFMASVIYIIGGPYALKVKEKKEMQRKGGKGKKKKKKKAKGKRRKGKKKI